MLHHVINRSMAGRHVDVDEAELAALLHLERGARRPSRAPRWPRRRSHSRGNGKDEEVAT
jgi:hypothetical protein